MNTLEESHSLPQQIEQPKKQDAAESLPTWKKIGLSVVAVVIVILPIILALALTEKESDFTPTAAPTLPPNPEDFVSSKQEKLDLILEALEEDDQLQEEYNAFPRTIEGLSMITTDRFVLAGNWVVNQDGNDLKKTVTSRFALATVFFALDGLNWNNKAGWLTDADACSGGWAGIKCCKDYPAALICVSKDSDLDIIEVNLSRQGAIGQFPKSLSLIKTMEALWLSENNLFGQLPGSLIGSITNLKKLYLDENSFTGPIPGNLGANNKLDTLYTHRNRFSGDWPIEFCNSAGAGLSTYKELAYFRLDCDRQGCSPQCPCSYRNNCYGNTTFSVVDSLQQ